MQITNEPNLSFMDGFKPYVIDTLIEGVLIAKKSIEECNVDVKIGFGSVPEGEKTLPNFWKDLVKKGGNEFIRAVDYVGHNFYVDVFEKPLNINEVTSSVENLLQKFRNEILALNGFPSSLPIRITENGWPTGKNPFIQLERSYDQQVKVIETIRTIYHIHQQLNITHYEFFRLRDANSSKDDLFHQFGLMKDDYTPKPAYYTFKHLIDELSLK
ncbi:hypothetical protein V7056_08950 [Bacillus sp. JJ664]